MRVVNRLQPNVANGPGVEHNPIMMIKQVPASQLVGPPQDENYMSPERKRKKMESMKVLQSIETYRQREVKQRMLSNITCFFDLSSIGSFIRSRSNSRH